MLKTKSLTIALHFLLLFLLLILLPAYPNILWAQTQIKGIITNQNNEVLPYATIYLKNTTTGTTSNANGQFEITIPNGHHILAVQFIGYQKYETPINATGQTQNFNIVLTENNYQLNEVIITPGKEDPAYQIIRNCQAQRRFYLKQITRYLCRVYSKGHYKLLDAPDKIFGKPINWSEIGLDTSGTGTIYLSESDLCVEPPNDFREVLLSSKISGDNQGVSFNRAQMLNINFYENLVDAGGIAQRGLISPIANNALFYYHYKLEGMTIEDSRFIYKIAVLPKRAHDPVFSGHIFIQDDTWRIHSLNLHLSKGNPNLSIADSLAISQTYAPVNDTTWVMLNQRFDFSAKVLIFRFGGFQFNNYSNYNVNPTKNALKLAPNEITRIAPDVVKNDSVYWQKIRPIPLTQDETVDYRRKETIRLHHESAAYKDSVDKVVNKLGLNTLLLGFSHQNSKKGVLMNTSPPLLWFEHNTIEGMRLLCDLGFRKNLPANKKLLFKTSLRYGIANKHFNPHFTAIYAGNSLTNERIKIGFGRTVKQWDAKNPISETTNTIYTLIYKLNYLRLYEAKEITINYQREILNGLTANLTTGWYNRLPINNSSNFSWRPALLREFTANTPPLPFNPHKAIITQFELKYWPKQKYERLPNEKRIYGSNWPMFVLTYINGRQGSKNDKVNFDKLQLKITQNLNMGLLGKADYQIIAGFFPNKKYLPFVDYEFINGNEFLLPQSSNLQFQLIDLYSYYTSTPYFKVLYEHHFDVFFTNKIPYVRKLKLKNVAGCRAFHYNGNIYYAEAFVGFENILNFFRVDYVFSLTKPFPDNSFQLSFSLPVGINASAE